MKCQLSYNVYMHTELALACFRTAVGLGDNENFMSRYIMRVIITIIDIIMISF